MNKKIFKDLIVLDLANNHFGDLTQKEESIQHSTVLNLISPQGSLKGRERKDWVFIIQRCSQVFIHAGVIRLMHIYVVIHAYSYQHVYRHVHIHINGRVTLPGALIEMTTRLAQYIIKIQSDYSYIYNIYIISYILYIIY